MTDNKRVTNKQILDKIDALKVGDEGLNALAIKIVSRMVKLKSMEDWFHHVSKSNIAWSTTYEDLDLSEEYNALVKLLMSLYICCSLRVIYYFFLIFYLPHPYVVL